MSPSTLTALSPLDGRYAAKLSTLRPIMSEYGYMHRRVQVELAWFEHLSDAGFAEFPPLSPAARAHLRAVVTNFSPADAEAIKAIEKTTNPRPPRSDAVMPVVTPNQAPSTVGSRLSASSQ